MSFFLPELSFFRDIVLILWQSLSGFMSSVEKKKKENFLNPVYSLLGQKFKSHRSVSLKE